jgi:hypothetical protein
MRDESWRLPFIIISLSWFKFYESTLGKNAFFFTKLTIDVRFLTIDSMFFVPLAGEQQYYQIGNKHCWLEAIIAYW